MKLSRTAGALLLSFVLLAGNTVCAGEFTKNLTPENLRASGLSKLTPEELAQLEVLIEAYKAGAVEKAVEATPPPTAATTKARQETRGILPDWVGALVTLKRAENAPAKKQQALESRIAGDFAGWNGRTSFKLENGQVWAQVNTDAYPYTPALKSPKVRIFPATFGTFWLEIEGVGQRCRVRPISLE